MDVWLRPVKKIDGSCYEYILLYTYDVLVLSENGDEIGKYVEITEASIGPPNIYFGGHVQNVELANGVSKLLCLMPRSL